ncbi:CPBP family glutamic-type intramembrane protease [Carnobacterium gallinarum]|uniref:CPBP family glutamic-type intramembrane protease n=1 Tax=Carnobacterium gallinarum TaxID=2749 RepID=UPI000550A9E8|nr:CPBP family glutamic-type intramembrane protease [Carnobacterium gallinarum]
MNELITNRKINPINGFLGFVILGGGFYLATNYSSTLTSVFAPFSLMIAGILAFLLVFGPSGIKVLFSRPNDPKGNNRNFVTYFFLALIMGFASGAIMKFLFGFNLTANPATERFLAIAPKIPFMLLGEELISFYILIVCAQFIYQKTANQKKAELVGIVISSIVFGLLHYTTYDNGTIFETLAHILLIQGSARVAFNLSGLRANSIILPLLIHIVYDLLFLSIGSF